MTFLPENYEVPKGKSNYFKFEQGQNKFRIVSKPIMGFEYWNTENKPVRLREFPEDLPLDIRVENADDPATQIKHFWAMAIIDRVDGRIKTLEITQKSIMHDMKALFDNEDWGDPANYDITVTREGEKLETKYSVQPSPHKELTDEEKKLVTDTSVKLEALFDGGDPFETKEEIPQEEPEETIEIADVI